MKKTLLHDFFAGLGVVMLVLGLVGIGPVLTLAGSAAGVIARDATIEEQQSSTNNGSSEWLTVRSQENPPKNMRSLVAFTLPALPPGAIITSATLKLYMDSAPNSSRTYEVYRTSADWVEGNGGSDNDPLGEVTWNNQPSTSTPPTSATSTGTTNNVWLSWDVTSDVSGQAPSSDIGWMIKDQSEGNQPAREAKFRSREYSNSSLRPQLDIQYTVPVVPGTLIVKKVMVGGADSFDFSGTPSGTISAGDGTISVSVIPGQYISTETAVPGWDLTSVSCDDTDSVGNVVSKNATFNVAAGEIVTCTFTNTKLATLTIKKILVNDDGGAATTVSDFSFQVNSGTITPFEADGQNDLLVPGGTYTVTEIVTPGYTPTYDGCENVVIPAGGTATCTITNDDNAPVPPSLTLVKQVVNDNGGTAVFSDWTVLADGPSPISGAGATTSAATFSPGTYTLSESAGPSSYAASAWSCTNGVMVGEDSSITLGFGQSTTCTITNDDIAPSLTLNKVVVNDNGGTATTTDWTVLADGPTPISGAGATTSAATFSAGTYTLSESGPIAGYTANGWVCTGTGVQTGAGMVTLALGQTATCTTTNDDIATTIIGKKFSDLNDNSVFDENESGIADWHIALGKVGAAQEGTTTIPIEIVALSLTGADGGFVLTAPTLGHYKVFEEKRSGWVSTTPAPTIDSFFDITYRPDLQPQQIPLVPDSFFDVFVNTSGQTIDTVGENVPIRFGNHQLPIIPDETPALAPVSPVVGSGRGGGVVILGANIVSLGTSAPQTTTTPTAPTPAQSAPAPSGSVAETGSRVALAPRAPAAPAQGGPSAPLIEAPAQGATEVGAGDLTQLATVAEAIPEQGQTANILSAFTALSFLEKLFLFALLAIALALSWLLYFLIERRKKEERSVPTIKGQQGAK